MDKLSSTIFEIATKKICINKYKDEYHVLESEGLDESLLLPEKYNVLYTSSEYIDALLWLKDYLRNN